MISFVLTIVGIILYILLAVLYWLVRGRKLRSISHSARKAQREAEADKTKPEPDKPIIAPVKPKPPVRPPLHSQLVQFDMENCRVICPEPFQYSYKGKGDDRIYCGKISDKWPIVIVADGASGRIDKANDEVIEGGGGEAAELVVHETLEYLNVALGNPRLNLQAILKHLRRVYENGVTKLKEHNIPSKTTLLIAFLCEVGTSGNREMFWFYAFEGDGSIVMMNPNRKMDGKLLRTELLMPGQKMFTTATVSQEGLTIPPVVACMPYEIGDIIYLASDGMDAVDSVLYRDKKTFLANYIFDNFHENLNMIPLNEKLSDFRFSDDAVLGLIWTGE